MSLESDYLEAFELHSPDQIRRSLNGGASPTALIKGKKPIDILIEMYTRSPRFAQCLRVMLDAGAVIEDPLLAVVLLDDDAGLRRLIGAPGQRIDRQLYPTCAYTSCHGVSALHVAAEFNSVQCTRLLLDAGVDINARAEVDEDGIGGQTPLFHAVNSNHNHCRPVMELLVDAGADLDVRLKGLLWGAGFEWETLLFDITPLSYAQCGLYRQFHRREEDIYDNIAVIFRRRFGRDAPTRNVPNRYLAIR